MFMLNFPIALNASMRSHFEEFSMEYEKVLRHGPTRRLSLNIAIKILLSSWPAICSYFFKRGEDECNKIIWEFVKLQEDSTRDSLKERLTLPEAYLYFTHHHMNILAESILLLDKKNDTTSIELHIIMNNLKDKIKNRLEEDFYW